MLKVENLTLEGLKSASLELRKGEILGLVGAVPVRGTPFVELRRVHPAFVDAVASELSPDAEMAVVGSAFLANLIDAVRTRGYRLARGLLPPAFAPDPAAATLGVPVRAGSAQNRQLLAQSPIPTGRSPRRPAA